VATQAEIEALYDWVHHFHTLRSGDYVDFSCAFFKSDFNRTLLEAQKAKHQWVSEGLGFRPGDSILDVGCRWAVGHLSPTCFTKSWETDFVSIVKGLTLVGFDKPGELATGGPRHTG